MEAIKKLDDLNRICLPYRMRAILDITPGSRLTAAIEGEEIHIKKAGKDDLITVPIDGLGRIRMYNDIMSALSIAKRSHVSITCTKDKLILRPALPRCRLCGTENDLREYKNLYICKSCLRGLKKL